MNAARNHGTDIATRDDWVFDASLAILAVTLVLAPYLVIVALYAELSQFELLISGGVGLGLALSLILRRHFPLVFFFVVTALAAIHVLAVPLPFSLLITVLVAVHATARYHGKVTWWVLLIWLPGAAACVLRWYLAYPDSESLRLVAITGAISFAGLVAGAYAVGRRGHDLRQVREKEISQALEAQRQSLLASSSSQRAEEEIIRADVADLLSEDVVKTLSTITVKGEEAKALIPAYPAQASRSIDSLLRTARETIPQLMSVARALRGDPPGEWTEELETTQSRPVDLHVTAATPAEETAPVPAAPPPTEGKAGGLGTPETTVAPEPTPVEVTQPVLPSLPEPVPPVPTPVVLPVPTPVVPPAEPLPPADQPAVPPETAAQPGPAVADEEEEYGVGGLDDIPDLVADVGAQLDVSGTPPAGIKPVIGETLFFVIDEALANVQKHAGPLADPQVELDWGDEDVEVSITNSPTTFQSLGGSGLGLDEMADRVAALGGELETGPLDEGGFRVWANLPFE